jgi:RNA polymerase primary sigma factor
MMCHPLLSLPHESRDGPERQADDLVRTALKGLTLRRQYRASGKHPSPRDRRIIMDGEKGLASLIHANLPMVFRRARTLLDKNASVPVELDDLISAGVEGLIDAVHRFDSDRRVKFSTYAQWHVLRRMSDQLRLVRWTGVLAESEFKAFIRISRAYRQCAERVGRQPTDEEVAQALEMTVSELYAVMARHSADASLDRPITESGLTLGQLLPAENYHASPSLADDSLVGLVDEQLLREQVDYVIKQFLGPRDHMVITQLFGLAKDRRPRTRFEVAQELGLSVERVRQIERAALAKLRSSGELAAEWEQRRSKFR